MINVRNTFGRALSLGAIALGSLNASAQGIKEGPIYMDPEAKKAIEQEYGVEDIGHAWFKLYTSNDWDRNKNNKEDLIGRAWDENKDGILDSGGINKDYEFKNTFKEDEQIEVVYALRVSSGDHLDKREAILDGYGRDMRITIHDSEGNEIKDYKTKINNRGLALHFGFAPGELSPGKYVVKGFSGKDKKETSIEFEVTD